MIDLSVSLEALPPWLLTIALHSALLTAAALLIARLVLGKGSSRARLLKFALLAPLVSSVLPWTAGSVYELPRAISSAVATMAHGSAEIESPWATGVRSEVPESATASSLTTSQEKGGVLMAAPPAEGDVRWSGWAGWAVLLLLGISAVRMTALALRGRRFVRRLERRPLAAADSSIEALTSKRLGRAVQITESARLAVPAALSSNEICLPAGCWEALTTSSRGALLAHELAHLARRDPLWFRVVAGVESGLFFLPWVGSAAKRFRRAAEFACDDQAAEWTGSRVDVARCLSEVASWLNGQRQASSMPYALPSMVSTTSGRAEPCSLRGRVEHLLEPSEAKASGTTAGWGAVALLGVLACSAPVIAEADGTDDGSADLVGAASEEGLGAAIVIEFAEGSTLTASRSGDSEPMEPLTCDVFSREGREALGQWLRAAVVPLPKEPLGSATPSGMQLEVALGRLAVVTQPDTMFREVQTVMALAADQRVLMPDIRLWTAGVERPVPLPRDLDATTALPGARSHVIDVLLRRENGRPRYTLAIADGPLVSPPVEIEEEPEEDSSARAVALPDPVRLINAGELTFLKAGLPDFLKGLNADGARVDARRGSTVGEVADLIDLLSAQGVQNFVFSGSYKR